MDLARLDLGLKFEARFVGRAFRLDDCLGLPITLTLQPGEHGVLVHPPTGEAVLAEPDNQAACLLVDELASFPWASLCWLLQADASSLAIQAHLFPREFCFPAEAPLTIRVDERIVRDLRGGHRAEPLAFLENEFLFEGRAFALIHDDPGSTGFRLLGPNYSCDIVAEGEDGLVCHQVRRRSRLQGEPVTLLHGSLRFTDDFLTGARMAHVQSLLKEAAESRSGYLRAWEIYNRLEEQARRSEALEFGVFRYGSCTSTIHGEEIEFCFHLEEELPPGLSLDGLDLAASERGFADVLAGEELSLLDRETPVGSVVQVDVPGRKIRTRLLFETATGEPVGRGALTLSLRGDAVRLQRRTECLERTRAQLTPLPTLGLLLETGSVPTVGVRKIRSPLSASVVETMGHPPTESQRQALDAAINTPDIALIQGPPGTGKTSVIRGLIVRLTELASDGPAPRILVSSYQHDAVDNAIQGLDVYGLPAARVGGRRSDRLENRDRDLQEWVRARQAACAEILASMEGSPLRAVTRRVDGLITQWRRIRGTAEAPTQLVQEILQLTGPYLSPGLSLDVRQAPDCLSRPRKDQAAHPPEPDPVNPLEPDPELRRRLQFLAGNLRLTVTAFVDDGPMQARRLTAFLEGAGAELRLEVPAALRRAAAWEDGPPGELEACLADLAACVEPWCGTGESPAPARREGAEEFRPLDELLTRISRELHEHPLTAADQVAEAIERFREDLDDPDAVHRLVRSYSQVIAGTCQQVLSGAGGGSGVYDVVIIDEAARANPLDLLIPMSLGRRIILVGDHRQLPHVLEEDVVARFVREDETNVAEFLQESLFARLFRQFQEAERNGSPCRTVRLQEDFRMHPVISRFVSATFYEDVVTARCSAEQRKHGLGLYGDRPVCWLDVPGARGPEQGDMSKGRPAEVDVLLAEVEQVLRANPEFSVGMITFYGAQARLLESAIQKLPFHFRHQIRVGTVDAFQGREFDVVFLSTVRSNRHTERRRRVGFLALSNRLCVAFSRARRLLVTIGDAETVAGSGQEPVVPALRSFYELCRGPEGWHEQR